MHTYQSLHRAFEAQVRRTPDAKALVCDGKFMSYDQLNRAANRLARQLQGLGIRPEEQIGLALERSFDFVVSMLAVVKAGGAYVPLDLSLPDSRLSFLLRDADIRVVLTKEHDQAKLQAALATDAPPLQIVLAGGGQGAGRGEDLDLEANLDGDGCGDALAYVSYTSGSTGEPKGVQVPHRSVYGFMIEPSLRLTEPQVLLQHSSIYWDAMVLELWPALLYGGTSVLFSGSVLTPDDLRRHVEQDGVTVVWLTSSLFNLFVDTDLSSLAGLRMVMAGGEALSVPHVCKAKQALPQLQLVNGYGPSECVVFSTFYTIPDDLNPETLSIPIGRPIGDRSIHLLNEQLQEVADGEFGELYVGGPGVARGYIKRPELTAKHFVDNPFANDGSKLYRTGDLVRRLPGGLLEFGGRVDLQVKIRGMRIELTEIESVLMQHPDVSRAAAAARIIAGQTHLVGYLVGTSTPLDIEVIRSFLSERLPSYMVPTQFMELLELPLNSNSKIDRHALPTPSLQAGPEVAPRDELERRIAQIWCDLLNLSTVSVEADFLQLGGNSLLATQVLVRITKEFGLPLSLRDVFQAATVADLAKLVRERSQMSGDLPNQRPVPTIQRRKR